MKKALIAIVLILSGIGSAYSQEAFNSLSFGVELGTSGVGVELALPVVTDHIVVKAGFNAPSLALNLGFTADSGVINQTIDDFNGQITSLGLDASDMVSTRFSDINLNFSPIINFSTAKVLVELYPFKKSSFHFTIGAYYGMGDNLVNTTISTGKNTWSEYEALCAEMERINAKYAGNPDYVVYDTDLEFNIAGHTFGVKEDGGAGTIAVDFPVSKVRPYLGLGFGRSAPDSHVGLQFDLGLWYHGIPSIVSDNEMPYNPEAYDITSAIPMLDMVLKYKEVVVFYPQITLRLIYKIF